MVKLLKIPLQKTQNTWQIQFKSLGKKNPNPMVKIISNLFVKNSKNLANLIQIPWQKKSKSLGKIIKNPLGKKI